MKTLAPIAKLNSREPKMSGAGMPARNKETNLPWKTPLPASTQVKATVDKVLNKIK